MFTITTGIQYGEYPIVTRVSFNSQWRVDVVFRKSDYVDLYVLRAILS